MEGSRIAYVGAVDMSVCAVGEACEDEDEEEAAAGGNAEEADEDEEVRL